MTNRKIEIVTQFELLLKNIERQLVQLKKLVSDLEEETKNICDSQTSKNEMLWDLINYKINPEIEALLLNKGLSETFIDNMNALLSSPNINLEPSKFIDQLNPLQKYAMKASLLQKNIYLVINNFLEEIITSKKDSPFVRNLLLYEAAYTKIENRLEEKSNIKFSLRESSDEIQKSRLDQEMKEILDDLMAIENISDIQNEELLKKLLNKYHEDSEDNLLSGLKTSSLITKAINRRYNSNDLKMSLIRQLSQDDHINLQPLEDFQVKTSNSQSEMKTYLENQPLESNIIVDISKAIKKLIDPKISMDQFNIEKQKLESIVSKNTVGDEPLNIEKKKKNLFSRISSFFSRKINFAYIPDKEIFNKSNFIETLRTKKITHLIIERDALPSLEFCKKLKKNGISIRYLAQNKSINDFVSDQTNTNRINSVYNCKINNDKIDLDLRGDFIRKNDRKKISSMN